jgi:alpha-D-ribose 1-methylphosphonate 5-triphosphate synthase subunit PhnG
MHDSKPLEGEQITARQRWMGILAKAGLEHLETVWSDLKPSPRYIFLRQPEIGLTMVQARAGNTGQKFNLGEITVTRCAIQLEDGQHGFGYVAGRNPRHAELCAVFDALMKDKNLRRKLEQQLIEPLAKKQSEKRRAVLARTSPTKVDFFTMVRGDE